MDDCGIEWSGERAKGILPNGRSQQNGRVLVVFEQLSLLRKIFAQYGEVERAGGVQWRDAAAPS